MIGSLFFALLGWFVLGAIIALIIISILYPKIKGVFCWLLGGHEWEERMVLDLTLAKLDDDEGSYALVDTDKNKKTCCSRCGSIKKEDGR